MSTMRIDPLQRRFVYRFQALMATVSVVVLLIVFATTAHASDDISLASFDGNYAGYIVGVGGKAPVLIFGVLTFNGDGTGSAETIWNLPGPTFTDRVVIPKPYDFRYEVDDNGIAVMQAEGIADIYFVVTRSQRPRRGVQLALEIQGMSGRLETSGGNIAVGTGKRLPEGAEFDARSLQGLYGGLGVGQGGRLLSSIGYTSLNGDGTGTEQSLWNLPDPLNIFQRQLALLASTVTYTVNPNGIGRAQIFQGDGLETEAWFVVTETSRVRGQYIADELFVVQSELDSLTGDVISGPLSRLSD